MHPRINLSSHLILVAIALGWFTLGMITCTTVINIPKENTLLQLITFLGMFTGALYYSTISAIKGIVRANIAAAFTLHPPHDDAAGPPPLPPEHPQHLSLHTLGAHVARREENVCAVEE